MNKTVKIESRNFDPRTFGGIITAGDFLYMSMTLSTDRIISAMNYDKNWETYKRNRDKMKDNVEKD